MNHVILLTSPAGTRTIASTNSGFGFTEEVESYVKQGWIKILAEYIPQSQTRVAILAKEE